MPFDVQYHSIKEVIEEELGSLHKISTIQNLADDPSKCLSVAQHQHCLQPVGVAYLKEASFAL
mgnify:CR=1 FL=1